MDMTNKLFSLCIILFFGLLAGTSASAQQKISILGDSYSTYGGYVTPDTNLCWYNGTDGHGHEKQNDVQRVEDTWWRLLADSCGYVIERNNSYSGSTVCNTGYNKSDASDRSFIARMDNLGNPDIILIFGGTNDSWAGVPIGEYRYADWTKEELYQFRPAFGYMLHYVKEHYPQAQVYSITNSELSDDVTLSIDEICRHYSVTSIRLHDVDKQWGHPSMKGMQSIYRQVAEVLQQAAQPK